MLPSPSNKIVATVFSAFTEAQPDMTLRAAAMRLALLACGLCQPARGQSNPGPTASAPLWGYLSVVAPDETPRDVTAFAQAGTSLDRAIGTAERQDQGRVVEIGFSRQGGYLVTLATSAGLHYARINPVIGRLDTADRRDVSRARLDAQGQRDLDALAVTHVTLQEAVASAELLTKGRAVAAGMEQLAGVPQFYGQTVVGSGLAPVIVDPRTGRAARPQQ